MTLQCLCGAVVIEDDPSDLRAGRGDHVDGSVCPFVRCDDPHCRALRAPVTLGEWQAAAVHWHVHAYLCGCSHGR